MLNAMAYCPKKVGKFRRYKTAQPTSLSLMRASFIMLIQHQKILIVDLLTGKSTMLLSLIPLFIMKSKSITLIKHKPNKYISHHNLRAGLPFFRSDACIRFFKATSSPSDYYQRRGSSIHSPVLQFEFCSLARLIDY